MRKSKITLNEYQFYKLRETKSSKEISAMFGVSHKALICWCYRRGIAMQRVLDWEIKEAIMQKTPKEIAYEYNVNLGVIYYRLRKMGINTKTGVKK